ncbi:MAG: DUF362 domain-containing protein [Clostridia bacterium]|nr:DUF362 domain-containing protein [Clostridia bacterium]
MKVGLVECSSYDDELVKSKVEDVLNLIGGLDGVIKKGMNVVIKANLVSAINPNKCATSHPSVVKAVAEKVMTYGANCIIADSSGGPFNSAYMNTVYRVTEMAKVCEESGAKLNQDFSYKMIENQNAVMHKEWPIINVLNNADLIINIAKLKTHTFMGYSGAVKNLYGAIPGLMKVEMHGNFKDQYSFSNYIIDIYETLKDKICLNIIDGVEGMEGDGPTSGTPIKMNCLLASVDAYSLDFVMLKIMGVDYLTMPLMQKQIERNLMSIDNIEIVGEDYKKFIKADFKNTEIEIYNSNTKKVPLFLNGFVHKLLTRRPVIKKKHCKGCKKCFEHCPVKAIEMKEKADKKQYAKIDCNKCIRCFCCQELCPFNIVKIKSGVVYKIVHRKRKNK